MAELKYTKHLLGKIEEVFKEIDYTIRYAKGSFQSGYCLVEQQKVVVVNKYYETEGRINVLIDILDRLTIEETTLTEKGLKTYKQVMKQKEGDSEVVSKETEESENIEASKEVNEEIPESTEESKEEIVENGEEVNEL